MFQLLKKNFMDNTGSEYIETIICMSCLLLVAVIMFSVCTALTQKLWLDEKMSDIAKLIDASGTVRSETISSIEDSIVRKFGGGAVTYDAKFVNDDANEGLVQLNDVVIIHYDNPNYSAVSIGLFEVASPIHLSKTAVSSVYYKPVNQMID